MDHFLSTRASVATALTNNGPMETQLTLMAHSNSAVIICHRGKIFPHLLEYLRPNSRRMV